MNEFVDRVYTRLEAKSEDFPENVKRYFPYMKTQNWLYNYQFEWGLLKSLQGLDRRTSVETEMQNSLDIYRESAPAFIQEFESFIADAQKMVEDYFSV